MIVFVRTKNETETLAEKLRARGFSAMAINGDVAQAQRERTVDQLQVRQARHPRRHRRRRPRARRRADQPRRQLRHPDRHRVLRAPDRPHRPRRAQRRRDLVRHPARALPAQGHREGHPPAAHPDAAADASRTSTPPGSRASTTRSPRRCGDRPGRPSSATSSATTCSEHDVPEVDVAAALAVVLQGDEPLLLDPSRRRCGPRERVRRRATARPSGDRDRRARRARRAPQRRRGRTDVADGDVPDRGRQAPQGRAAPDRRRPRQRGRPEPQDFGHIDIRGDLSLRRAARGPAAGDPGRARSTRISGKLIELRRDGAESDGPLPGTVAATSGKKKPRTKKGHGSG